MKTALLECDKPSYGVIISVYSKIVWLSNQWGKVTSNCFTRHLGFDLNMNSNQWQNRTGTSSSIWIDHQCNIAHFLSLSFLWGWWRWLIMLYRGHGLINNCCINVTLYHTKYVHMPSFKKKAHIRKYFWLQNLIWLEFRLGVQRAAMQSQVGQWRTILTAGLQTMVVTS